MTAWATGYTAARTALEAASDNLRTALRLRCQHTDSGGAQCTADAEPAHTHRWRATDLPYDDYEFDRLQSWSPSMAAALGLGRKVTP